MSLYLFLNNYILLIFFLNNILLNNFSIWRRKVKKIMIVERIEEVRK